MAATSHLISGRVRDVAGNAVPWARIYFTKSPVALPDIAMLTGADGAFTLSVPAEGSYEVECAAEGFEKAAMSIKVVSGQHTQVEMVLRNQAS